MNTAVCPACQSDVIIDDEAIEHDLVTCANCGVDAEIVSLNPLELAAIEEESASEEVAD